ncbi:MAG: hypothetical protein F4148_16300 [Caldilineaceae bacterium SB0675_bin_29]|uniref:Uncharacterized protein n=1 Tax=Caldilineaceae bacterium SB0675_bin_29 TaxID=2605266 RepID=A0A6B1G0A5_9CHLR|nr:hypothetical protein [Caldilineaceae bacterium SB0675_bin_29]
MLRKIAAVLLAAACVPVPEEDSGVVMSVTIQEFDDRGLKVEVMPWFDARRSELEVAVIARRGLDSCRYQNPDPIWVEDLERVELVPDATCSSGAEFGLDRVESVSGVLGGGLISSGYRMNCVVEEVPPELEESTERLATAKEEIYSLLYGATGLQERNCYVDR